LAADRVFRGNGTLYVQHQELPCILAGDEELFAVGADRELLGIGTPAKCE